LSIPDCRNVTTKNRLSRPRIMDEVSKFIWIIILIV
jgi:hypothetical protein